MTILKASHTQKLFSLMFVLATPLWLTSSLQGQATISTGNINGQVTDATDAAVAGAKVTITRTDTGVTTSVTTNGSGFYNSGSIAAGTYLVKVEAKGFESSQTQILAKIGNNSAVNFKLKVGAESTTVNVEATSVGVNTEQTSVQGVLTADSNRESAGQWPQFPRPGPT